MGTKATTKNEATFVNTQTQLWKSITCQHEVHYQQTFLTSMLEAMQIWLLSTDIKTGHAWGPRLVMALLPTNDCVRRPWKKGQIMCTAQCECVAVQREILHYSL